MTADTTPRLPESTLLVGRTKTGKSQAIADKLQHFEGKVLWLAFDNTKVFSKRPDLLKRWTVRVIADWDEFETMKNNLVNGKEKFDIIVIDGIAAMARLNMDKIAPNGQMSQPQWGIMSKNVHRAIRALRDVADLYATVVLKDTDYSKQGERPDIIVEYDLNQDLQKRVLPEFGTVLYTHSEDVEEDGATVRKYLVLETSVFAFQYTQN